MTLCLRDGGDKGRDRDWQNSAQGPVGTDPMGDIEVRG